jgi:hypothetical protein
MISGSKLVIVIAALLVCVACKKDEGPQTAAGAAASPAAQSSAASQTPSPSSNNAAAATTAKTDACALLTSAEIESVQREAVKETKLSGSREGGFSVSRCFFTLPTFTNSISLQITQRGEGPEARDPKRFWRDTFHREHKSERKQEKEKSERKVEEEGESAPPVKVTGVGDEAFWMGTRVGGALYVLKGNNYLRVSVGGSGEPADKIKRSKELAQKVAARL